MEQEIKHIIFSVQTSDLSNTVHKLTIKNHKIISISYEDDIAHIKIKK
jgi:hypothetical protein